MLTASPHARKQARGGDAGGGGASHDGSEFEEQRFHGLCLLCSSLI